MTDILTNPAGTLAGRLHLALNMLGREGVADADTRLFRSLIHTAEGYVGESVPDLVLAVRRTHVEALTVADEVSPSFVAQRAAFHAVTDFLRDWEEAGLDSHPFAAGLHQTILDRHQQEQAVEDGDDIFISMLVCMEAVVRKNLTRPDLELLGAVRGYLGGLLEDEHRFENSIYWGRVQLASQLVDQFVATQEVTA